MYSINSPKPQHIATYNSVDSPVHLIMSQAPRDVAMSRYDGGGRAGAGLPLSPHLDHGPVSPEQPAQFKPKRKLMTKFLNEPVDALDLRLANAEKNLSTLPVDPFTDIKQEVREPMRSNLATLLCTAICNQYRSSQDKTVVYVMRTRTLEVLNSSRSF